jgi:hypothetical protein
VTTAELHEIRHAVGEAETLAIANVTEAFGKLRARLQVLVLEGPPGGRDEGETGEDSAT